MSSESAPVDHGNGSELEATIDQAIKACDGDLRATIRALIVANRFLESEVRAFMRGRFETYTG